MISVRVFYMLAIFILISGSANILSGCSPEKAKADTEVQNRILPIVEVRKVSVQQVVSVPGSVFSDDRIELSSRVIGFIQDLEVREGQHVSKGDLLVRIDSVEVNEAIRQAQASVEVARKDLDDAQSDVEKYETLAKTEAIALDTLRKAKIKRDVAVSNVDKAKAALKAAEGQRSYTSIQSPVDGVIIACHKHRGDMATTGSPILTIESRRTLLFKIFVSENKIHKFSQGLLVKINLDALPGQEIDGTVRRVVPSGDTTTRRYEVDVTLPQQQDILPGMFGRAEIAIGDKSILAIPYQAKILRGGLEGVFVVDENNIARFRWLRFGKETNNKIEVTAGLSSGEKIIAIADDNIRDGEKILAERIEN